MSDNAKPPAKKIDLSAALPFAPVYLPIYSLVVSFVFLYGYWSRFDINIFAYVSLTDIPLLAAYSLLPNGLGLLTAIFAGRYMAGDPLPLTKRQQIREHFEFAIVVGWGTISMVYVFPAYFPFVVAALISFALLKPLIAALAKITSSGVVATALVLAVTVPLLAAGLGITKADQVRLGFANETVDIRYEGQSQLDNATGTAVHHLGHVGDYDFFFVPKTSTVLLMPSTRVLEIQISHRELCTRCYSLAGGAIEKLAPLFD